MKDASLIPVIERVDPVVYSCFIFRSVQFIANIHDRFELFVEFAHLII